jgi:hypothetical protein
VDRDGKYHKTKHHDETNKGKEVSSMPRSKQSIPANETNDKRFARVATQRVNSILTSLKQLGSLGNPNNYTSNPEQRKQIQTALTNALEASMQAMARGESVQEFKLK